MAVVLKTPWAGHPAGATLALPDYDERALVRGGAAAFAGGEVWDGGGLVGERASPLSAPVTKPATPPKRRGRPPKVTP